MLDPKKLREDAQAVGAALAVRGFELDVQVFENLEAERRTLQVETEALQATRNKSSKAIGQAKARGEDIQPLLDEVASMGDRLKGQEDRLTALQAELDELLLGIPNIPDPSVPEGADEASNREERRWGEARDFTFTPRDNVDLGAAIGGMDFEVAAKIAASRFVVLAGPLARLHRALIQFMLDTHTGEHGYREVYVPYLVNAASMKGTGQLPKFKADLFEIPEQELFLIPTAEVPVTNLAREEILDAGDMPARYVCHT
ncbi:MAG: serine--tRNA ligase, partial [Gammaproteobacteria bacterium]|nr:serine--tRNA ligase [Gammaproteobacteria bacterium]